MNSNKSLLLFWISPVLGIIEAFKHLKSREARQVLFLFCLCFGFCFSVGTQREEGSSDGISMRVEFEENKDLTASQFCTYLSDYFEFDTGAQDIYIVTMSFLVGRVTENYHFFFLALAFVFAFFQLKCLRYFVKEVNFNNSLICIILSCLFLWNNIYNINGARFWTASWIGLFCVFKVFHDNKPQYLLLAACTLMVHASFALFPVMMLAAFILKQFRKPLLILFCISWAFSVVAEDFHLQFLGDIDLPFAMARKVEIYTDSEYLDELKQGTGFYWVRLAFNALSRHYVEFLILLIALNVKKINDKWAKSVVGVMIVLATIANFGMIIPTFGTRFFMVNYALVAYSFLVAFGDKKYRKLVYMLPFVWFMNLFYLYKDVTEVLDLGFVLTPIFSFLRYLFA